MQIHWNPENNPEPGISLNRDDCRKLVNFLSNRSQMKGIPRDDYEEYRDGQREFMPFQHFESMIDVFGDEFVDLFFKS